MPYISEYTIVEDGDVYRIRLTDGKKEYDSVNHYRLKEALNAIYELKKGDGIHG